MLPSILPSPNSAFCTHPVSRRVPNWASTPNGTDSWDLPSTGTNTPGVTKGTIRSKTKLQSKYEMHQQSSKSLFVNELRRILPEIHFETRISHFETHPGIEFRTRFGTLGHLCPPSRHANRYNGFHMAASVSTYFRSDNRSVDQLRPVRLTVDFVPTAEGSVLIELGHTRVLCNATVENSVPGWLRNRGQGWVTAEYGMLPRATLTRTPRESERGKVGGRTHEIQRLIGRSLRAAVDLKALGERTIILDCDVLQADGGTRTAAITGAAVALGLAINRLVAAKILSASPIRHLIAAVSVGIVDGTPLLDLAYEEDARADVDMNVVMTSTGDCVEVQATAEHNTFSRAQHSALLDMAAQGTQELIRAQQAALEHPVRP